MLTCVYCGEPIEGDKRVLGLHDECAFRLVGGSAAHILKECACFGGTRHDPPGMSKREAARLALDTYRLINRS